MWVAYFCMGSYKCNVVVVIKTGAYIHGCLLFIGAYLQISKVSLVPRLLCGGGGKRAWYSLLAHAPSSLGNLHTTPLY